MEPKNLATPQHEKLELAIRDFEQEQASTNKVLKDVTTAVNELQDKLGDLEEKLNNQTVNTPAPDLSPVQQVVEKNLKDIQDLYIKVVLKAKENNFQAFLKSDAKKWLVILIVCCLLLTYLYFFGLQVIASKTAGSKFPF